MDFQILKAFGHDLKRAYNYKVSSIGTISASSSFSDIYKAENLFDADEFKTWIPADNDKEPELTITLSQKDMFDKIVMQEHMGLEIMSIQIEVVGYTRYFMNLVTLLDLKTNRNMTLVYLTMMRLIHNLQESFSYNQTIFVH